MITTTMRLRNKVTGQSVAIASWTGAFGWQVTSYYYAESFVDMLERFFDENHPDDCCKDGKNYEVVYEESAAP